MMVFAEGRDFTGGDIVGDRKDQEDFHAFLMLEGGGGLLAIVADGMGGHAAGEVASRLAVESFARSFQRPGSESIPVRLGAALQAADNAIASHIATYPEKAGMGCTLLAAHFSPQGLYWLSVGDSLLYLARKGKITQINEDHSMAPEIAKSLKAGRISAAEARNHPHRNALRSAVMGEGYSKLVDCPSRPMALSAGDMIMLASDGIQSLSVKEIGDHLKSHAGLPLAENVSRLLWAVQRKKRPNQDNTTVQLIRVPAAMATPKRRRPGFAALVIFLALAVLVLAGLGVFAVQKWAGDNAETRLSEPTSSSTDVMEDPSGEKDRDGDGSPGDTDKDRKKATKPQDGNKPSGVLPAPSKRDKAPASNAKEDKSQKDKTDKGAGDKKAAADKAAADKAAADKAAADKAANDKAAAEKAAADIKAGADRARKQAEYEKCKRKFGKNLLGECEKLNPNPKPEKPKKTERPKKAGNSSDQNATTTPNK